MPNPLVLDFDASVLPLPGERRVTLSDWQEAVRFGCRMRTLRALALRIDSALTDTSAPVFMGSGDFHHISFLLIERLHRLGAGIHVVVLDNHPDNMRYPFGIHCGSWVRHVSRLAHVASVSVLGICSTDVDARHAWENYLLPLRRGKVRYACIGRDVRMLRRLGARDVRSFASVCELLQAFAADLAASSEPIYLSIDKDVLSANDAHTNWDQGVMRWPELLQAVELVRPRLVGCDVVGEVSVYNYQGVFKRILSGIDGQPKIPAHSQGHWQSGHQALNRELLQRLER